MLLAELARLLVKVSIDLVEGLIPASYPDWKLLAKQFYSNWNYRYIQVTSLDKGG